MPPSIPEAEQEQLRAEARKAIGEQRIPAVCKRLTFSREEYVPNARDTLAAEAMPGGEAWYRQQIREYTTLDLDPDEIHAIGLREVDGIQREMDAILSEAGFEGDFADLLHFLRTDPQFYARPPEDLLRRTAWIPQPLDGHIDALLGHHPRGGLPLVPVPAAPATSKHNTS